MNCKADHCSTQNRCPCPTSLGTSVYSIPAAQKKVEQRDKHTQDVIAKRFIWSEMAVKSMQEMADKIEEDGQPDFHAIGLINDYYQLEKEIDAL